jgi:Mor family transcriptional regulator
MSNTFESLMRIRASIPPEQFQIKKKGQKSPERIAYEQMEERLLFNNRISKEIITTPKGFHLSKPLMAARNAQIRDEFIYKGFSAPELANRHTMTLCAIYKAIKGLDYRYKKDKNGKLVRVYKVGDV